MCSNLGLQMNTRLSDCPVYPTGGKLSMEPFFGTLFVKLSPVPDPFIEPIVLVILMLGCLSIKILLKIIRDIFPSFGWLPYI